MKIFITGASGFIGRHVAEQLAQKGHELRCLVRKTSDTGELKKQAVTLVIGDVTDRESLRAGIQGCDRVINLANVYSFWEPDNRIYETVNVRGTMNVMESALQAGVSKVVHVSSVVVYGKPAEMPFTEASPVGARHFSRYARSKYQGDLSAWDLCKKKGLPLVMVYPGAVLGPGDPKSMGRYLRDLVRGKVPANIFPDSSLTFVHVRDVAEIIVRALEQEGNSGEKYFACCQPLSFRQVNALVREISGVSPPKLTMPGWLAAMNAGMLTAIARLTKKPPPWGMSTDQIATMRNGFIADGSKATRELGIAYTPVRTAIEEEIAAL